MAEQFGYYSQVSASRKVAFVVALAILGIVGGTIGFMVIEELDPLTALYMTMITLSTVGFGEIAPLHEGGRIFVIFLIIFGVVLAGTMVTFVSELVIEGQFQHLVKRRKMQTKLKKMSNHYIIAGFGRVGQQVARQFAGKQVAFVIVEKDLKLIEKVIEEGLVPVEGDATEDDILIEAGIKKAHTLISTLPEETQNVYLTLTARHMNPDLNIIARADFIEGEKKLLRAGANHVVIPHVLGGIRMAKAALQPHVTDFMQMASEGGEGLLVEELVVPEQSPMAGKTLAETNFKQCYGVSIIGIKEPGKKMNINPTASTVLDANDILVVIGEPADLEHLGRDLAVS